MRELPRKNSVPLFRRGTRYRNSVLCDLAKVSMSSARRSGIYRVAGLLEFALGQPEISCELIADSQHVSPTLMKMLYRAKGAHGICLVTDSTAGAGLPDGSQFALFGKDCVVENGVCLLADRSALAGSAARMCTAII